MQLTKNFTFAEFNFRDLPLDDTLISQAKQLAENTQAIRDFLGKPVRISSWYRPAAINSKAKGSKTSQHLHGEAMDFYVGALDSAGLDDLFRTIIDGKIKLPHACTQIIRESKDTPEQIKKEITNATSQRLDSFAQTRNYGSILSACTYATSTNPQFAKEGQYCVNMRDDTWCKLY